jgi:hypothetical protein
MSYSDGRNPLYDGYVIVHPCNTPDFRASCWSKAGCDHSETTHELVPIYLLRRRPTYVNDLSAIHRLTLCLVQVRQASIGLQFGIGIYESKITEELLSTVLVLLELIFTRDGSFEVTASEAPLYSRCD